MAKNILVFFDGTGNEGGLLPDEMHDSVYERLKMESVRNYTSYGKYRPAPLLHHDKAKQYFEAELKSPQV
jgi:hypothetical protein